MKSRKFNMNLHHKIFVLLLAVGMISFAIACFVSLAGLYSIRDDIGETGNLMADDAADFTEHFAEEQVKKRLTAVADGKAALVSVELKTTLEDVDFLATSMTEILQNPQRYKQVHLPNARRDTIVSGKAFVHFSRKLALQYGESAFASEIALASNIMDELEQMDKWYNDTFIGSAHGYLIVVEVTPDGSPKKFSERFLESYDPRNSKWYALGVQSKKPAVTKLYTDAKGKRCVTCVAPYYDAAGLAGVVGIKCNSEAIFKLTEDKTNPENDDPTPTNQGFILENETGRVIFSTFEEGPLAVSGLETDLRKNGETQLAKAAAAMASGRKDMVPVLVDGEKYYLAFAPVKNQSWSYGALIPAKEITEPTRSAREKIFYRMDNFADKLQNSLQSLMSREFLVLLLIAAILFFVSSAIAKQVVEPVNTLVEGVKQIAQGNLDERIDMQRNDELAYLADNVNAMAGSLKEHIQSLSKITAEKERIATELSVATDIQEGMLPRNFADISRNRNFELFAVMNAAREVGGDFYDFYMLDDHRLVVTVADVSGKGVPAALFMVISKTILKNTALSAGKEESFAETIRRANRQLCEYNEKMMFVTVFFGVLDTRTGDFTFVSCGHNPPLLRQGRSGEFNWLKPAKKNLMLGVFGERSFHQDTLRLAPGSILFCYTDGVTEAMDEEEKLYSEKRFQTFLNNTKVGEDAPVADWTAELQKDIAAYVNGAEQSDDITMLVIRYDG